MTSIPLTSFNCGTFYYLPPECLVNEWSYINDKVDIWSIGIIYYMMLFGWKPFGHNMSPKDY